MRTKAFRGNASHTNPGSALGLPNKGSVGLGEVTSKGGFGSSRILAPSNIGFVQRKSQRTLEWNVRPAPASPGIKTGANITHLLSYKSPTRKSDGVKATDYSRVISKCLNGFPYEASNSVYNIKNLDGDTVGLHLYPLGSDIYLGQVSVPAWLRDQVILQAVNDMNQVSQNVLEDLAQLKQTGIMVADLVATMAMMFSWARKGSWGQLRNALREKGLNVPRHIANGWLMYFYGIKPMVSTIEEICTKQKPLRKSYSTRKRAETETSPEVFMASGSAYRRWSGVAKLQAQCGLRAIIDLDGNMRSWTKLGLGPNSFNNLAVTAWALTPYSFVLDWFVPVEAWLRSLVWSPAVKFQGGYVGSRHDVKASYVDTKPFAGPNDYRGTFPHGNLLVRNYQRKEIAYSLPSTLTGIRLSLSPTQVISAAALIVK